MQASTRSERAVTTWLLVVCGLIIFLIAFGGFVRLTRSGLSIVEWNPISGVVPPIGHAAWEAEFAKYQLTPEYLKVNTSMTLPEYQEIFLIEYIHRLIARFAGLLVAIPLIYFLIKGWIPKRQRWLYILVGILFAFQGVLGWYMVSSGLVDTPAVSHFRLTAHLLLALTLLAITFRLALDRIYGRPEKQPGGRPAAYWLSLVVIGVVVVQISYGGLVAGLKAGYVSNTWPLMFGYLVPPGMLTAAGGWLSSLLTAPTTVHFIHRWLAFGVLLAALAVYFAARRHDYARQVKRSSLLLAALVVVQISLGISVVLLGVPIAIALAHQFTALLVFMTALYLNHRLAAEPVNVEQPAASGQPLTAKQAG
ncbi:MAG: COX15/CtaA family protein [Anaerolineae bacterium]|nr:COX15/CtaA family protein [Anaerolineae bacterium]MCB9132177.1 COX15/CtaA family protein [Anaerolineales bacterium]MCB0230856.1 COX15/CtaA family protein [Anaerolineae bacterium]MCB0237574.1 COX15/CtaA family protein [Anaerolineae bacterium]MCB0243897.1 COX15/CtaA family protein [Anaerolineae bacterium]